MLHLISYSYPPDNVPAAHRPYQLATHLRQIGISVAVCSRSGWDSDGRPATFSPLRQTRQFPRLDLKRRVLFRLNVLLRRFLEVDKALPWAVMMLPGLTWRLLKMRLSTGQRQVVWATAPLTSNIYLAGIAAGLSGADLHLDLRDAIDGLNGKRASFLTRFVVGRAKSLSAVTETLCRYASDSGISHPAALIYNGISTDALSHSGNGAGDDSGWVEICYTGAVYGGDRPYVAAIELLSEISREVPDSVRGIRLTLAGREDLSQIPLTYGHERFSILLIGEVSKHDALALAGASEVNLVLVGSGLAHRCAIPLKVFDLLGVGRPILFFGPRDSDAKLFLQKYAPDLHVLIDSEGCTMSAKAMLGEWLLRVRRNLSSPKSEPSSESQCALMAQLLGVAR